MEQAPEDQGPQREPYNEWTLELLEELKREVVRHGAGNTWAGVKTIIRILQQQLFIHFRIGCQHSRIGIRNGASRS
uniref:Protein Vpr n=1 Tax=Human immunodeficiency virus type 1 TaxID=11676 RepID=S4WEW1_HV1|nr:vpr protein [Human immunodeficiency virus 1]